MIFTPISIDDYVKLHIKKNPSEDRVALRKNLEAALDFYKNYQKCECGNDIWVIGSAAVGNGCFTCITGKSKPDGDYEIDDAIIKRSNKKGRRHIDDMDPTKIAGFFDDDGYEIIPELLKKPPLCLLCANDDNPEEVILCTLTRHGQENEDTFVCHAFRKK